MEYKIHAVKLTGAPDARAWTQIHEFKPEDAEKLKKRGHLVSVLSTSDGQKGVESVTLGREIIARLHEEYFGSLEKTSFNALKDAVQKVADEFKEVLEGIQIAAFSLVSEVVYLSACGGAEIKLFRDASLVKLISSKASTDLEVASASGYPKEGDVILAATKGFFDLVADSQIKEALATKDIAAFAENLAPVVHAEKQGGGIGVFAVKFEKEAPLAAIMSQEEELPKEKQPSPKKLSRFLEKIAAKLPERKLYVREVKEEEPKEKKTALLAGGILIVILLVSIVFGLVAKQRRDYREKYETRLVDATHKIEEAIGLQGVDDKRAKELFLEGKTIADRIAEEGVKDKRLTDLLALIDENKERLLKEYQAVLKVFVDLTLFRDNLSTDLLLQTPDDSVYILDKAGKRIISVVIETAKTDVAESFEEEVLDFAVYADKTFVVVGESLFLANENKALIEDLPKNFLIQAYAGNLYVLDKERSTITRYPGLDEGFGEGGDWLSPGTSPDLAGIVDWAFDGSVWLLSQTGSFFKYTRGNQVSLTPGTTLKEPVALYTNESLEGVYILDRGEGQIKVFDKEGTLVAQYQAEELSQAKEMAVSEETGLILVLVDQKLYSFEIKHR